MVTSATEWLAALAFISVPAAALALVWIAFRGRLLRCPETGGLGLVELQRTRAREAAGCALTVRRCDLWPQRRHCGQGCLAAAAQSPKSSM